ncbi:hypothetical protein LSH36_592g00015 [Paralvinella palmiformis]|uniref:Uncharacterized protein n=1 Tax=Paralvinella palmiformis TaxID=53620 RepID=A0AAD9J4T0_9ANNE|nr:hypothetical protein LSH36_592g00015 [Paralvinella palmiformis]
MEKIGSRAFWILGVMTLMLTFGKVFGVSMCGDGDTYGYKPSQKSNITKQNNNSHYLSGTVWHSQKYGRFSCCGVIKAIEVIISKTGDIEFQVWSITVPVSKTATFLGYYRTHVDIEDGVIQNVTIPFDKQMPIRDGNAIGWVADESDIIKWAVNEDLINETDSDYLFEDFSEWSKPFASHPPSFSTLLNQHSFMNKGIKKRVFGVRPVVHPEQVTIERDLTKAVLEKPYEVTFTVSDGCHSDQTATLYVYVFDDDRDNQLSGCKSKEQRAYPPSAMWNQDQTEKYPEITEVGCPAPKIAIPPEKQFFGRGKDFTFG